MSTCTHPHIFRISVRDAYHCLACGEPAKVEMYDNKPAETAPSTPEDQYELWHMIEVDKKDIHILHVTGCDSEKLKTDPNCRVMRDLISNKPDLAIGEYDAYANGMEQIKYIPRKRQKLVKTSQRTLPL